jgi:transcriptional regulator with XRE-family HTH domain
MSIISDRFADELAAGEDVRNAFVGAQLRSFITNQIRTLRAQHGFSQEELAKSLNTSQSTIARLENRDYGKFSLNTLLELAQAFDVALIVEFAEFPDFLLRTKNMSERALARSKFARKSLDFLCRDERPTLSLVSGNTAGWAMISQVSTVDEVPTTFIATMSNRVTEPAKPLLAVG